MGAIIPDLTWQGAMKLCPTYKGKPQPMVSAHDFKYDIDGVINQLKTRWALQGHRGNMQKGVHFWDTFSATPREDTARALQAMLVMKQLKRRAADIEKAYCWADLPKDQWLIASYPVGFEKYNDDGEAMYMVIPKALYGAPPAGRIWGLTL